MLFKSRFSVTLLSSLSDIATELDFGCEKTEHADAPIVKSKRDVIGVTFYMGHTIAKACLENNKPVVLEMLCLCKIP